MGSAGTARATAAATARAGAGRCGDGTPFAGSVAMRQHTPGGFTLTLGAGNRVVRLAHGA
jgi:hypothetical protein